MDGYILSWESRGMVEEKQALCPGFSQTCGTDSSCWIRTFLVEPHRQATPYSVPGGESLLAWSKKKGRPG
jgi:hypothetical protein